MAPFPRSSALTQSHCRSNQPCSQLKPIFQAWEWPRDSVLANEKIEEICWFSRWKETIQLVWPCRLHPTLKMSPRGAAAALPPWGNKYMEEIQHLVSLVQQKGKSESGMTWPAQPTFGPTWFCEKNKALYVEATRSLVFWFLQLKIIELSNWTRMVHRIRSNGIAQYSPRCGCSHLWTFRYFKWKRLFFFFLTSHHPSHREL